MISQSQTVRWEKSFTHLATEAVPDTSNALDTEVLADVLDGSLNNGVNNGRLVVGDPRGQVGLSRLHIGELDGVAAEEVRDHGEVAIVGELVGEELGVDVDSEDVAENDNGLLGRLVALGVDEVCLGCSGRMLGTGAKGGGGVTDFR